MDSLLYVFNKSLNILFIFVYGTFVKQHLYPQFWAWKLRCPLFE